MKYDLDTLISLAIMSNEPVVLVEGIDDRPIYIRIASVAKVKVDIYPIENIENYSEGCDSVIKCVNYLQPRYSERVENDKRVVGIIDRDVRPYRDLMPHEIDYRNLVGLFILQHYSIENYFVTRQNAGRLLTKITFATPDDLSDELTNFLERDFVENEVEKLWFLSIEALKKACDERYDAVCQYGNDRVKDAKSRGELFSEVQQKSNELERFAQTMGISKSDYKKIIKGKWLLHVYVQKLNFKIHALQQDCRNGLIPMCQACKVDNFSKCFYRLKTAYQDSNLYQDMLMFVDEDECSVLINFFKTLSN